MNKLIGNAAWVCLASSNVACGLEATLPGTWTLAAWNVVHQESAGGEVIDEATADTAEAGSFTFDALDAGAGGTFSFSKIYDPFSRDFSDVDPPLEGTFTWTVVEASDATTLTTISDVESMNQQWKVVSQSGEEVVLNLAVGTQLSETNFNLDSETRTMRK